MPSFKKGISSGMDIFRPIAAVASGCGSGVGMENDAEAGQLHCTIFRGKGYGRSRNVNSTFSSDESIIMSFPVEEWPPPDIPGSESTDSKSVGIQKRHQLDRSVPIRNESDEKGSPNNRVPSPTKWKDGKPPPSYYKIEVQGDMVQLSAGDDSSVHIDQNHNNRIKLTGEKSRSIIRASPIEKSPDHPSAAINTNTDQKWTVSSKGQIIALPLGDEKLAKKSTVKSSQDIMRKGSSHPGPAIIPLLTKASTDSNSDASNEMMLPESPPRLDRSALSASLFQEEDSTSSGSKNTSSNKSTQISKSSHQSEGNISRSSSPRPDFFSQVIDFFSLTCCEASVCKNGCYTYTSRQSVSTT